MQKLLLLGLAAAADAFSVSPVAAVRQPKAAVSTVQMSAADGFVPDMQVPCAQCQNGLSVRH